MTIDELTISTIKRVTMRQGTPAIHALAKLTVNGWTPVYIYNEYRRIILIIWYVMAVAIAAPKNPNFFTKIILRIIFSNNAENDLKKIIRVALIPSNTPLIGPIDIRNKNPRVRITTAKLPSLYEEENNTER
nr:hypothetical protein [Halorubrum halophilum]